jgi:undecaprenyl-diphosphatase
MVGVCSQILLNNFEIVFLRLISLPGDSLIPVVLVLIVVSNFLYKRKFVEAGILAIAPLIGNISKFLVKNYFQIPRPAEFGCQVLGNYGDVYSFPSGHTIFATIFFGFLAYLLLINKKKFIGFSLMVFILLVGVSRYLLGAHWILDVLGGYLVGGSILMTSILVYNHFSYEKSVK